MSEYKKSEAEEQLRRLSGLAAELMEISRRCAAYPDLDERSEDEILGYNEIGGW